MLRERFLPISKTAVVVLLAAVYITAMVFGTSAKIATAEEVGKDADVTARTNGSSKSSGVLLDTPATVVGALKKNHPLRIYANGREYKSVTPFWIDTTAKFSIFDAKKEDGMLVRVYSFVGVDLLIEEDIDKEKDFQ